MTRAELAQTMTHYELMEWSRLEGIEPWGERRLDLLAGIIAATIANVNRGPNRAPYQPKDFMPQFDAPPKRDQTPDEIWSALDRFDAQYKRKHQPTHE